MATTARQATISDLNYLTEWNFDWVREFGNNFICSTSETMPFPLIKFVYIESKFMIFPEMIGFYSFQQPKKNRLLSTKRVVIWRIWLCFFFLFRKSNKNREYINSVWRASWMSHSQNTHTHTHAHTLNAKRKKSYIRYVQRTYRIKSQSIHRCIVILSFVLFVVHFESNCMRHFMTLHFIISYSICTYLFSFRNLQRTEHY